jgi:hypothetical protein
VVEVYGILVMETLSSGNLAAAIYGLKKKLKIYVVVMADASGGSDLFTFLVSACHNL